MEISPKERPTVSFQEEDQLPERKRAPQATILFLALAILAVAGWLITRSEKEEEPPFETVSSEPITEVITPQPAIEPATPEQHIEEDAPITPTESEIILPALDESDDFTREQLLALNNSEQFNQWLQSDNLVRRGVALTDGISKGVLLQKFLPISPPDGKFSARKEGQQYWIDAKNYQRYNLLVDTLTAIEPEQLVNTLKPLKPLLDSAFAEQGYKDRTLEQALSDGIDLLLSTPTFEQPPELKLESVYFKYLDPNIEALFPIQKQLIRSGPDNTLKIQSYLKQLKEELAK